MAVLVPFTDHQDFQTELPFFVGLDEVQSLQRRVDIWHKLLTHILDAAAHITNVQINPNKQHTIFTHELQVHLALIVGFSNIDCELQQICQFCVTN